MNSDYMAGRLARGRGEPVERCIHGTATERRGWWIAGYYDAPPPAVGLAAALAKWGTWQTPPREVHAFIDGFTAATAALHADVMPAVPPLPAGAERPAPAR